MTAEARWCLAIVGYFAVQLVLRLAIGTGLELDESEQMLLSRHLAWGYGAQPPLYHWLQWAVFQATGPTLLGLALLKQSILAATLVALFLALRREVPATEAGVATLSVGLLPQVIWEAQRSLTHTPLAVLMTVLAYLALTRAVASGRRRDHVLLGLVLGLGLLAKLNFAFWAVGAVAAVSAIWAGQGRLRPIRLVAAAGIAALVVAPAAGWMLTHPDLATGSVGKFGIAEAGGLAAAITGTASFWRAMVGFFIAPAIVLGAFAALGGRAPWPPLPPGPRLMALGALLPLPLIWAGVLVTGATEVNDRWLAPVSWMLVPALALAAWRRLGGWRRRALLATTAGVWLLAMAALPHASLVNPGFRATDFRPLAARLAALAEEGRPLYVAHAFTAGNLVHVGLDLTYLRDPIDVPSGPAIVVVEHDGALRLDPILAERVASSVEAVVPRGRFKRTALSILTLDR